MVKRCARVSLIIESTAWVAGGVLLIAYAGAEWHFSHSRALGLQEFAAARQQLQELSRAAEPAITTSQPPHDVATEDAEDEPLERLDVSEPDMTEWSAGRINLYLAQDHSASPQAVLRIPSIRLEVPVYAGATAANLNRGAAWIESTAPLGEPGNAGLASHRDGYFRALRDIALRDRIELQTLTRTYNYVVDDIRIVEPEDVYVLDPSQDQLLTLVTCYPFYRVGPAPKRFVVRAHAASARNPPQS